jgi:mannose-6-phosphate isomerase
MAYLLLDGVVQPYRWGGYDYLAQLTHAPNPHREPRAELWFGTHPKGPARIVGRSEDLAALIAADPRRWLGKMVAAEFDDRLPFLLKVLDVRAMLSIQAHPTRAAAAAGFAREEAAGIPLLAPQRNYRDRNHKPELAVALTAFHLLHGFRSAAEIRASLFRVPGWSELVPRFDAGGVKGLYQYVMELPQAEIDRLLRPLHDVLAQPDYETEPGRPDYWAQRAFARYTTPEGHLDRGIFSIYWLNLVHLQPGQGIFQAAGIPHAYLEGVVVELMANSDNVLRGGLTPKHVDVPELLAQLRFDPVRPKPLLPQSLTGGWRTYETPAEDFLLARLDPPAGETVELPAGPAIYLLLAGELRSAAGESVRSGQGIFVSAAAAEPFTVIESATIFRAGVPGRAGETDEQNGA